MKKAFLGSAVALALSAGVSTSANAALTGGEILNFADGVPGCAAGGVYPNCQYGATTVTGSYFAMDTSTVSDADGDGSPFEAGERVAMINAGTGLTLGSAQGIGDIDNQWIFGQNPGFHHTSTANGTPSVNPDGTVDMSGWTVYWGAPGEEVNINMGTGAAATVTCGVDCAVGDTFTLDYTTIVPAGQPFAGVPYQLHLEGVVAAVPVPAAIWLFGSGLLGLVGVARRRRAQAA